ncbi:hypothetical protein GOEFS_094_00150 [Gordonia effusa NBRC 100432]|uniref:Anti-sigma-D factor RsdA sigma factor binding region domain-containing protein n=1 Tax=Gordonia effusa NBRC 100432 TaxID=1077974 RepID=H0R3R5_9ACTN|nr:anti-sigma-D factor RsdA [Gordonia effusa]GAB19716.1 hypothetical protein GOEFS_094_00150 [Gordonia effusa NBRC 100432]
MSDELSRRRLGSVPNQPSNDAGDSSGWQHHGTETPLDMHAVRADDEFLEALARDMPVSTSDDAEYQLAGLLAGWRHDLLSEPAPEFPSIDEVERAIIASQPRPARKAAVRHLRLASGAAAVVVVAAAGLTVLSQGAAPGDPLWGVKKVVFAEQASQTQAATNAQQNLERAEEALSRGETQQAQSLVNQAAQDLKPVRDEKTRKQMDDWIDRLRSSAPNTAATSKSTAPTDTKTQSPESSDPATIPPDIRNQMRSSQTTEPSETNETVPSTVPVVPSTTNQTTLPTPSTKTGTPTTRPGGGPLPPISIRPN